MSRTEIFQLEMPLHEDLVFHQWLFRSGVDGPEVSIVTGLHGDELNGPYIAWRLIRELEESPDLLKSGTLRIIPAANPLAINLSSHRWPFDQSDLNALFPGYDRGETVQRIAARIHEAIRSSDYGVSIHTGGEMLQELPQVRVFHAAREREELSRSFRLPLVWKREISHPTVRTLFPAQMTEAGVPTFAVHVGAARRLNRFYAEDVVRGLANFLSALGMRESSSAPFAEASRVVTDSSMIEVAAPDAGLFLFETDLGRAVREGDLIGRIVDPVTGGAGREVRSAKAGLLSTIRVHPLTYEGDLVARIAVEGTS